MNASEIVGADMIDWYVERDRSSAGKRGSLRIRRDEERANSLALVITMSLLFVLLASALMVGSHAAIGSLLSRGEDAREPNRTGDIVYTMPDGVFCRHLSFDNATGAITEEALERCSERLNGSGPFSATPFKWGTTR